MTPLLEIHGVHNMMAIPVITDDKVTAVLYFQGSKNLFELDESKLAIFSVFAHNVFQIVDRDTRVLASVFTDNKLKLTSTSSKSRTKTANIRATTSTNYSTLTASGSSHLFQKSQNITLTGSGSMTTAKTDDDLDISNNKSMSHFAIL